MKYIKLFEDNSTKLTLDDIKDVFTPISDDWETHFFVQKTNVLVQIEFRKCNFDFHVYNGHSLSSIQNVLDSINELKNIYDLVYQAISRLGSYPTPQDVFTLDAGPDDSNGISHILYVNLYNIINDETSSKI